MLTIKINSQEVNAPEGQSVLKAALSAGIYIPHLCSHPDLDDYKCLSCSGELKSSEIIHQSNQHIENRPSNSEPEGTPRGTGASSEPGCKLCLVEINPVRDRSPKGARASVSNAYSSNYEKTGLKPSSEANNISNGVKGITELHKACGTIVTDGMEIVTEGERIKQSRQENLAKILSDHPHSCLTCAQSEGCSLTQCSSNVPQNERCCPKFGRCELQKISRYIGIAPATPRYIPKGIPIIETDPLFKRDYNLCIGCLRCVRACRNLRGVDALGFVVSNNQVVVGSRKPSLMDSGCKFCGACVEVCPTGAIMDKIAVSSDRRKSLVPCQGACPVGMDAPNYIRLIKEGKTDKAFEVISHKVPFPSVLGNVCFHPCEENCRRKELNPAHNLKLGQPKTEVMCEASEPISICALKRYATENITTDSHRFTQINTGTSLSNNKIAVVGGGPSGLSAAYYLAQNGYPVTIFETEPEIGGMMRYALPEYRLPLSALKNDLRKIIEHPNITIKPNSKLGKGFTIDTLKKDGFKSVLIAIGAQNPKKIMEDKISAPVLWGIDFLKSIRHGKTAPDQFKGKNILVIGGGNVAIDAALSAKRLGAKKVQMACLESRDEMPAHEWEIQQALDEGIALNCSWGPKNIAPSAKGVCLDFQQCTSVFDSAGKFNPSFNADVCTTFDADIAIITIGQSPNTEGLTAAINPNRTIKVDENTLATSIEGVFACGEAAHNPSSIIESIADGRKSAENIDKYLGGDGVIDPVRSERKYAYSTEQTPNHIITGTSNGVDKPIDISKANPYLGRDEGFAKYQRIKTPCIELSQRNNNFAPVETGFNDKQAKEEASRCLQCDLRLSISPVIFPPEVSKTGEKKEDLAFTEELIKQAPAKEGVYILFNANKETILIKGAINIRESLLEQASNSKAKFFHYETDPMYTKKESELIQAYLAKHGKLPSGGDEMEDLY